MTRYFIRELSIEGFRGINNVGEPLCMQFKSGAVNSVFAPNAQGKSSVFEALSYAIKGVIPKLEEMPAADRPAEYYANRFHGSSPSIIDLSLEPDDGSALVEIRVERATDGSRTVSSPSGYPDPDGLLLLLDSEMCLVDNRAFLRFVEDTPLDRGRSFSGLLGIGQLSEFRQALATLAHSRTVTGDFELGTLQAEVNSAGSLRETAERQIRTEYKAVTDLELGDLIDVDEIATAATQALKQISVIAPHLEANDLLSVDWDEAQASVRDAENGEGRSELTSLIAQIAALEGLASTEDEGPEISRVENAADLLAESLSQTKGVALQELYHTALGMVESGEWEDENVCPVCQSRLSAPLSTHLKDCLADYDVSQQRADDLSRVWKEASCVDRLKRLVSSTDMSIEEEVTEAVTKIDQRVKSGKSSGEDISSAVELLGNLDGIRRDKLQSATERREELRSTLPKSLVSVTEQVNHGKQLSASLKDFQAQSDLAKEIQAKLDKRKGWAEFIREAASSFSDAEVRLSTARTQLLENTYKQFYSEITHNPEIVPALKKSPGSEELYLVLESFYGLSDLSAPSLLPESCRNALAISIFLSAALESRTAARFIVMDDVTSSFDAGHQFQLMELIRTTIGRPANPDGPQIIMLSHDGLLEKYFDRLSSSADWHHQKIQGLPPKGVVFTQTQTADRHRARAEHFLNTGQVEQAEPLVRQYLEFCLQQVIQRIRVPVPFDFAMRDDRKMVQACLDAIKSAVLLHKAAGDLILTNSQVSQFEAQHVPAVLGNWVSHYATGVTSSFTPQVLESVLDSVDSLVECFKYDCNCSGSTQKRFFKSLSAKHCTC